MTLRRLCKPISGGLLLLAVSFLVACNKQGPQPFSADCVMTSSGRTNTGKMYFSTPRVRIEAQSISWITDGGTQTAYILFHDHHKYFEIKAGDFNMPSGMLKVDASFDPKNPCSAQPDIACKKVATETVNGRVCDKWEFIDKNGGWTTKWVDQTLNFPIKSQQGDATGLKFSMELSNVKEGQQESSLFEVPWGYRKMEKGETLFSGPRRQRK